MGLGMLENKDQSIKLYVEYNNKINILYVI